MDNLNEYVSAAWLAKKLGTSQQNVSLAGKRALSPNYRGDFLRPDAIVDDGRPIWLKENALQFIENRESAEDG